MSLSVAIYKIFLFKYIFRKIGGSSEVAAIAISSINGCLLHKLSFEIMLNVNNLIIIFLIMLGLARAIHFSYYCC